MKHALLALVAGVAMVPCVLGATRENTNLMTPIRQFIDGFNKGDTQSAFAAYVTGEVVIVDEFAPHRWIGAHAAQDWATAYDKHAQATGVSDGSVTYGEPTRTEMEGNVAYVIVPTVYHYREHGKAMAEEGEMTFVLHGGGDAWKISAWAWSGVRPHAAK